MCKRGLNCRLQVEQVNVNCRLQVEQIDVMESVGGPLVLVFRSLCFLSASQIIFSS